MSLDHTWEYKEMEGIVIKNNIFIDTANLFMVERDTFTEYFPKLLIGNHLIGDECWCQPQVHHGYGVTIIHKNPKLLNSGQIKEIN